MTPYSPEWASAESRVVGAVPELQPEQQVVKDQETFKASGLPEVSFIPLIPPTMSAL